MSDNTNADLVEIGKGSVSFEGPNKKTVKITLKGDILRRQFIEDQTREVTFLRNSQSEKSFVINPVAKG